MLARLRSLHPRKIDLSLHRCARLLRALGDPQRQLASTIHIAGTNGKGSTLACLESCLQAMGFRTQAYLSPHLCRFNERIRLGEVAIDDGLLAEYLRRAEEANAGGEITFFEITTAAAFLAFAEHSADFLILETGLGGRLDATNLVERKCAAVLTPIDYDHAQFLGNDLDVITSEKVAIAQGVNLGVNLLLSAEQQRPERIIDFAREREIPLYLAGRDFSIEKTSAQDSTKNSTKDEMTLHLHNDKLAQGSEKILLPCPKAIGEHQRDNAALAAVTLLALFEHGLMVSNNSRRTAITTNSRRMAVDNSRRMAVDNSRRMAVDNSRRMAIPRERLLAGLRSGVASFSQPARLQRLSSEDVSASLAPSLKALTSDWEVLLDGAHNPHAARAVVKALEQHWQGQPYCLILCLMEGKDARAFTEAFAKGSVPDSKQRIARGFAYGGGESAEGRFLPARDLAACARESHLALQAIATLEDAFHALIEERASLPPRLLIAGSLYLAAEVLGGKV